MLNLTIYDFLEKMVNESEVELEEFQRQCGCDKDSAKLGINSLQSIVRSSVIEEQQDDPMYSRLFYRKSGYESIKLGNLKFDIENIASLLVNAKGIMIEDKCSIILSVFNILAKLKNLKVSLSPAMGIVVTYLYKNNYEKRYGRMVDEETIKEKVRSDFENIFCKLDFKEEFYKTLHNLDKLGVIEILNGEIWLIEEVSI